MPDIFLSYSRDDQATARLYAQGFEREGLSVWWDQTLHSGEAYDQVTEKALEEARAVVVLWSKKSVDSRWVRAEATQADRNGTLVPVMIEPCKRPIMFELTHTADLSHWRGDLNDPAWQAYAADVRRFVQKEPSGPALTSPGAIRKRGISGLAAGIFLALLLIAGAAGWMLNHIQGKAARPAESVLPAPASASVAVLPFVNMSSDPEQQYFSEGLSEELIDLLTKIPGLQVPARTSSFYFKNRQATIAEIAKALGVAHVLEGSVRKSGKTLRITVQLIRVDNGYHVWSETFDRQLADVFKIQDEIAKAVVQSLKVSLLEGSLPKAALTTNTEAYTLYLQAVSRSRGGATKDFNLAIDYLHQAIALDDNFAAAWALLAEMLISDLNWHMSTQYQVACAPAHHAADKALELQPGQGAGHLAKGHVLRDCDWNWNAAEVELQKAVELDPGNAGALGAYSHLLWTLGRSDAALETAQEAIARDPLNARSYLELANAQGDMGSFAAAETSQRRALALNPTMAGIHALLAHTLLAAGKPAAALDEAEKESDDEFRHMTLPLVLDALGRHGDADRELATLVSKYPNMTEGIAEIYACRGDSDEAMRWFERNFSHHGGIRDVPAREACTRKLKDDPRFKTLRRKMGLPA